MNVLVTGGLGFIGSHVVERLTADKHRAIILDDRSSSCSGYRPKVPTYTLTLGLDKIGQLVRAADAVVHCAAHADIRHNWRSAEDRAKIVEKNVRATVALLEAINERPMMPLVFLSSASVYGRQGHTGELHPESPYAASKVAGEAFVRAYSTLRPWWALRLVNTYGMRVHRGVIPDFIRMARTGHIHALDRGAPKSAVHVADVAGAVVRCLADDRPPSGVYDVTSNETWGWRDLVELMGFTGRVTWEEVDAGCVGDPVGLLVTGSKLAPWYRPRLPVREGVSDALRGLGWALPLVHKSEAAQ